MKQDPQGKNSICALFLIILLFVTACGSNDQRKEGPESSNASGSNNLVIEKKMGNSASNINQNGFVASEDGWIYYSVPGRDGLFKMKEDGSEVYLLSSDQAVYINVLDGWIYYTNESEYLTQFKVRVDGTERTQISEDVGTYLTVVGDWLYYVIFYDMTLGFLEWEPGIIKMRLDGSERTRLNNDHSVGLNFANGWVYYSNADDDYRLYRMRTDGSERKRLNRDSGFEICLTNEWIYHTDGADLYRVDWDGKNREKIDGKTFIQRINVADDWLYYTSFLNKLSIYRVRLDDGNEGTRLTEDDTIFSFNLLGNWVYYLDESGDIPIICRVPVSGGVKEVLPFETEEREAPEIETEEETEIEEGV